jgi:hypothetical protein
VILSSQTAAICQGDRVHYPTHEDAEVALTTRWLAKACAWDILVLMCSKMQATRQAHSRATVECGDIKYAWQGGYHTLCFKEGWSPRPRGPCVADGVARRPIQQDVNGAGREAEHAERLKADRRNRWESKAFGTKRLPIC